MANNINEYDNNTDFATLDRESMVGTARDLNSMEMRDLRESEATKGSIAYRNLITETNLDLANSNSDIARVLRANGIYQRGDLDDFNSFYIFQSIDPYKMLGTTKEYVFFTKPDLHIFERGITSELNKEIANDPLLGSLMYRGYADTVLANLQYSVSNGYKNPFIPLLSNYKQSNLELNSVSAEDMESAVNMYGTKIAYRSSSYRSDEFTDFSLDFKDDKYLNCYLWFKAYDQYQKRKAEGRVTPVHQEYSIYKIISDQMTLFKFIVGEDGETIVHWSAIWGCYPKSVPRETFSDMPADGQLHFSTQWHGSFQDDMDPKIINHFNWLCRVRLNSAGIEFKEYDVPEERILPLWDDSIKEVTGESAFCPFIVPYYSQKTGYRQFKLIWIKETF